MKLKYKPTLIAFLITMLFSSQSYALDSSDKRTVIQLTVAERNLVLAEMREFLEGVQKITQGVISKDMKQISNSAKKLGSSASKAVPATLAAKLPMGFKKLAMATHKKFDEIAQNAEDLEDAEHSLSQLGTILNNCVACHAIYKFEAVTK